MKTVRIANGAGFLGDWIDAPRRLLARADVDYLTIEHLAELTMSILARLREKDPQAGYAEDFLDIVRSILPELAQRPHLKIVANSGGVHPHACVRATAAILCQAQLGTMPLACVSGDDLLPRLSQLVADGCELAHLDTGMPLADLVATQPGGWSDVVAASAYLGARPIAQALAGGARLVITGRVADASLTVGPAMHELGWDWHDWNRVATASVAGHLIECGAQVTGGYSVDWSQFHLADVGYPIAELDEHAGCVITKPPGSGGAVTRQTVVEQLVYEIGDPAHYLTPDVDCDFTTVQVQEAGPDRVAICGATGRPPPDTYKVSLAYRDGWMASGQLLVYGPDCREKAEACAQIILERCRLAGFELARTRVELLGFGGGVPGTWFWRKYQTPGELVLRVAAHDPRRQAVEYFARQFAPLITSGPAGLAGYAAGRPVVRPVYAYWPTRVPRDLVTPRVEIRPATDWLTDDARASAQSDPA
jgi:hypothetical protein